MFGGANGPSDADGINEWSRKRRGTRKGPLYAAATAVAK